MASIGKKAGASQESAGGLVLQPADTVAAGRRNTVQHSIRGEHDHTGGAPTTTALARNLATEHARSTARRVDNAKLLAREETEGGAVRGPERCRPVLRAGQLRGIGCPDR